jgi:hypothetical protein
VAKRGPQKLKRLDHEDVMELAVQLTCSYLSASHSGSTDAEEVILTYYRQQPGFRAMKGDFQA